MADAVIDTIEEESSEIAGLQESDQDERSEGEHQQEEGWGEVEKERAVERAMTKSVISKIPSQHSKARLSRMSASTMRGEGEVVSSDDDEDAASSVLITEIKQDGEDPESPNRETVTPGRVTQIRLGRPKRKKPASGRRTKKTEEEEWDTDLEEEVDPIKSRGVDGVVDDPEGGKSAYLRECEKLGVVPVSYFIRHLEEPEIIMRYHGLGPQGTQAISKILKENMTLEKLNLCGNWMEAGGAFFLCRMLHENDYITELSLAENKIGSTGITHVAKMLAVNSGLRKLDLSNNGFTDKDAELLADALEQNKFLRELNLSHNHFGSESGEVLGPAIGANDILDTIDLSWNQIRKKGAVCIARGLKENVRLKVINLAWNGFGHEGGAAIGDALGVNETLQEIDISGNRIDVAASSNIARGLRKNEDLLTLRMGNNPITTKGAIEIAHSLHDNENSQLTCLDFTDIPVESELLKLCEAMEQKRQLRLLHGPTLRSGNTPEDIGKPGIDPFRRDPFLVLREHIFQHDVRINDVLGRFDTDHSYSVSPEDFTAAMEEILAPLSKEQVDDLIIKLDVKGDGKVFYGDLFKQMEESARLAQEKGYMGFVPKTPNMHSRNQTFINDSRLREDRIEEAPETLLEETNGNSEQVEKAKSPDQEALAKSVSSPPPKSETASTKSASNKSSRSPPPAPGSRASSGKLAKLEMTQREVPV